jgi:tetrahydromethanopterin S-methyltransferase subunit G
LSQPEPPPGERGTARLPDAPATVEDVQTLRRWLWVAGVWAGAASIIAVIALFTPSNNANEASPGTQSDIADLEQRLTGRLDNVEQKLDEAPSAEDLQRLDERLRTAENELDKVASSDAAKDLADLSQRVDDLERRVEELEAGPPPEGGAQ